MDTWRRQMLDGSPVVALLAVTGLGVAFRAYWAVHYGEGLEGNGCEYARIAENLLERGHYVGLYDGPELMFPPFYPMLIALVAFVVGPVDLAVRIVPFIAGALLVP